MEANSRLRIALAAALLSAIGATSSTAADMSVDQIGAALKSASATAPADFAGKDLSDLGLSGLDFRKANLRGASLFSSKLSVNIKNQGMGQMRTDLSNANLAGAGTIFRDVKGFTQAKGLDRAENADKMIR